MRCLLKTALSICIFLTIFWLTACGLVPGTADNYYARADSDREPQARDASEEYNFYPGTGYYPSGTSATYAWQTPAGSTFEGFETYIDGNVIESSAAKHLQTHVEVTSGVLDSRYVYGSATYRRAFTDTYNFRMLIQGLHNGLRVKWMDQALRFRFNVDSWQTGGEDWQGIHAFARYRTENNLYVASLRRDGTVVIKEKVNGIYTTLGEGIFKDQNGMQRAFNTKQWYTVTLAAIGNHLRLYVDNILQLEVTDGSFSWGTMGIRTDFANVYLDDLKMYDDLGGL